jgi:alkanesulfonate monooxygenase
MTASQPLDLFWSVPVSGDSRHVGTVTGDRPGYFDQLKDIALAADRLGFKGLVIPTGQGCDDPWVTAAALAPVTEHLQLVLALRPGVASPTHVARQAAALHRISNGRLMVKIVCGGDPAELAGDGIFLNHGDRYAHASEFLTVYRRLLEGKTVDLDGDYITVTGAQLAYPPQERRPPVWLGGSSKAALDLAAEYADTYLIWGEPLDQVEAKLKTIRRRSKAAGREVRFGLRIHLIVRPTEAEAWDAADKLIADLPATQRDLAAADQMQGGALPGRGRDPLLIVPNLSSNVGLARGGKGAALVGDPPTVAKRLRDYQALGIETVIASGCPHLEEAHRVAALLFPELGISAPAVRYRENPPAREMGHVLTFARRSDRDDVPFIADPAPAVPPSCAFPLSVLQDSIVERASDRARPDSAMAC